MEATVAKSPFYPSEVSPSPVNDDIRGEFEGVRIAAQEPVIFASTGAAEPPKKREPKRKSLPDSVFEALCVAACEADDRCNSRCSTSGCEGYKYIVNGVLNAAEAAGFVLIEREPVQHGAQRFLDLAEMARRGQHENAGFLQISGERLMAALAGTPRR